MIRQLKINKNNEIKEDVVKESALDRLLKAKKELTNESMEKEVVEESALDRILKARGKTRDEFEAEKRNRNNFEENLNEDTAGEKFTGEPETEKGETITDVLDRCAKGATRFYRLLHSMMAKGKKPVTAKKTNTYNPLFIGPTGAGKTSIVETWARDHGYELISDLNTMGDALDFLGVKTIDRDYELEIDDAGTKKKTPRVATVATKAFDRFLRGNTKILFLDEINKINPTILKALYDLISFHAVNNGDEWMPLPKLLFVVGAMNPSDYEGDRYALDPALKRRMQLVPISYDTEGLKKYLLASADEMLEEATEQLQAIDSTEISPEELAELSETYEQWAGIKDILEKVFENPARIHWTDPEKISNLGESERMFTPGTFEGAINYCDGTKTSFIKSVQRYCGIDAADQMNNILANYKDKDHKANLIWDKNYDVKEDEEDKSFLDAENSVEVSAEDQNATELRKSALRRIKDARKNN